jgi:FMN phosphatase YigB (HAD superfamily)
MKNPSKMTKNRFFDIVKIVYKFLGKNGGFMKKLVLSLLALINLGQHQINAAMSAVFIDVTTIFYNDTMQASSYIGKINALRYTASVGHTPNQEDLFRSLKPLKAQSTQVTYNNNLEMPLILSDWLAAIESNTRLKDMIQRFFESRNMSDIEKKVLFAIVSMMMTPAHLADTQKISSKMRSLLERIKSSRVKLYLTGNWAHIASLRSQFPDVFRLFDGVFVSGDLHLLKPAKSFYETVMTRAGATAANSVWIESETKFATSARSYGFKVIQCGVDDTAQLAQALRGYKLNI